MSIADKFQPQITYQTVIRARIQVGYSDSSREAKEWFDNLPRGEKVRVWGWCCLKWNSGLAYGWERTPLELAHVHIGNWNPEKSYSEDT